MQIGFDKWTLTPSPRPQAKLQLVCLPHAGGGAFGFRAWPRHLRSEVELIAVQYPGRENRYGEAPVDDAEALLRGVLGALDAVIDRPYVFFGHSLGARLAYRLACRRPDQAPRRLFLSAAPPPRGPPPRPAPPPRAPNDAELIEELRRLGGTPKELMEAPDLLRQFLPAVRADFAVSSQLDRMKPGELTLPFVLLAGADDGFAPLDKVVGWRGLTTAYCPAHRIPGGHFFPQSALGDLMEIINQSVEADLRAFES